VSVSIVPLIDTSGSMAVYNYLAPAKADASTFVNMMSPGDQLAVVAFTNTASIIFPTSGSSVVAVTQAQLNSAVQAIQALGAGVRTNMAAALADGYSLLSGVTGSTGMVLLSDGMWNTGGQPTLNGTTVPIYTIALGAHGETKYLNQVAATTGGKYYQSPDAWTLQSIYNDIVNQASIAQGVSQKAPQPPSKFQSYAATVESNAQNQYFSVAWVDPSIQFTTNNPPVGDQVNISLQDPNGAVYTVPTAVGAGFAVFKMASPAAGQWQIGVWTAAVGGASEFKATWGSFNPDSSVSLALSATAPDEPGAPLRFHAEARDGGEPVPGVQMTAVVEAPTHTLDEVKAWLRPHFERIEPPAELLADGVPEDTARLIALDARQGNGEGLIPRRSYPLLESTPPSGVYEGLVADTRVRGTYTLRITAHGYSERSKTHFARSRRVDVEV